eukprot:tig00020554_g10825.t1
MADKIILALTELGPSLSFRGANDAVVFACLALLRDSGFRFVEGAGEGQFPSNWQSSADVYAFRMKHSRSALNFLIKFVPMEDVMLVHAMTAEDKRIHTLELKTGLYARNAAADEAFTDKINELASQLRASIISKIFPEAGKEGYEADSSSSNQAPRPREPDRAQEQRQPEHPRFDPLMDPTFQPRYPPMRPLPVGPGGVGGDDLLPGGIGGFGPRPGMGGGSMVGPNHPMFGPARDPYFGDPSGGLAGPVRLPRGAVPPGPDNDELPPPNPYWL